MKHTLLQFMVMLAVGACATVPDEGISEAERVTRIIDSAFTSPGAQERAFDELLLLEPGSAPYLVGLLGDQRQLPRRNITIENPPSVSFERYRTYSPEVAHDAISAILNHITGENFVFVYNGASNAERRRNQELWRQWCVSQFPGKSDICQQGSLIQSQ